METPRSELPEDYVRFCSFAAGEFEDEAVWHWAEDLAKAENRTHDEVEGEFKEKLRYVKGEKPQHPYETWGPQELADRINKASKAED